MKITAEMIDKIMMAFRTGKASRLANSICKNIANATTPEEMAGAIQKQLGMDSILELLIVDGKPEVAQLIKDIHDSKQEQKTACAKPSVKLTQVRNSHNKKTTKKTDNSTKK
jgi:hypothetical protein